MDHHDFLLAVQLVAEENVGTVLRKHQRTEDEQVAKNRRALQR